MKFDGWRAQLHFAGDDVIVFTRNGNDVTRRFGSIAAASGDHRRTATKHGHYFVSQGRWSLRY